MHTQAISTATFAIAPPRATAAPRVGQRLALGILLFAVVLHFFRLDQEGFANLYYAATVKSMLTSWSNFFFASFDPGGFVAVDKPPLGFWIQALSATLFGFSGISLLLPQALAGVLSVALTYYLVRRVFGVTAGLVAALVLTVTPISIAANRNNTMDSLLVLTSLFAAWAVSRAAEKGKLRWLVLGAVFVGLGFNIKMLQAILVLPAFWFLYLVAGNVAWWKRLAHLAIASVVLALVALAWVVAVDVTPANQRPFVGSSQNNTEMELILGHNGLARLGQIASWFGLRGPSAPPDNPQNPPPQNVQPKAQLPPQGAQPKMQSGNPPPNLQPKAQFDQLPAPPPNAPANLPPPRGPGGDETGQAGVLRLFNQQLAGQTSWLLPLALLGFSAAAWQTRVRVPFAREHQALLLWGGWLAPQVIFFSYAGLFHRYYLEMLSPAIAALVGAGVAAMWHDYRAPRWRGWLLPAALFATALVEIAMLAQFPEWSRWLAPVILATSALAALALVALRCAIRYLPSAARHLQSAIGLLAFLVLLLAPTAWSLTPVLNGGDAGLPYAGPDLFTRPNRPNTLAVDSRLVAYLQANRNGARFLAATINANSAAPLILATGEPVMALGGFGGGDKILSVAQLAERVAKNDVRFFLMQPDNRQAELTRWITERCAPVNAFGGQRVYDCAGAKPTSAAPAPNIPAKPSASFRDLTDCTAGGVARKMGVNYPQKLEQTAPAVGYGHGGGWTKGDPSGIVTS